MKRMIPAVALIIVLLRLDTLAAFQHVPLLNRIAAAVILAWVALTLDLVFTVTRDAAELIKSRLARRRAS